MEINDIRIAYYASMKEPEPRLKMNPAYWHENAAAAVIAATTVAVQNADGYIGSLKTTNTVVNQKIKGAKKGGAAKSVPKRKANISGKIAKGDDGAKAPKFDGSVKQGIQKN